VRLRTDEMVGNQLRGIPERRNAGAGNLDTKSADEVFALLRRFNRERGTTVLFVTHIALLADRCDKIIEVIDGRIAG
jgi:ABC-type lipoprotein export system ATPase subunit